MLHFHRSVQFTSFFESDICSHEHEKISKFKLYKHVLSFVVDGCFLLAVILIIDLDLNKKQSKGLHTEKRN